MIGNYIDLGNPVSDHPLNDGRVFWLNGFSGYQGIKAQDLTPKGNDGTLTNGMPWIATKYGHGFKGDGTNDYVALPAFGIDGPFAAAFWVNGASAADFSVVLAGFNALTWGFQRSSGSCVFFATIGGVNESCTATGVFDNTWHRVCGVYTGADMLVHRDGKNQVSAGGASGAVANPTLSCAIAGLGNPGNYHSGIVADVSIWKNNAQANGDPAGFAWREYEQSLLGHPDTLRRFSRRVYSFGTAAAGGSTVPAKQHSYRRRRVA